MLFSHVPDATLPEPAPGPSKAQDTLEALRHAQQRRFALESQLEAERREIARLERRLLRQIRPGETVAYGRMSATREGAYLFFDWGS